MVRRRNGPASHPWHDQVAVVTADALQELMVFGPMARRLVVAAERRPGPRPSGLLIERR
jgi:hypothetical protein